MNVPSELEPKSFVLLRLGERRFAVAAADTAELVSPSRVFSFPHRTPHVEGVIFRRGRIVPVCDVAEKLIGTGLTTRRFYLIALRRYRRRTEWVAIPVTGECALINAELTAASASDEPHVAGWLSHDGDVIEVLNLDALTPGLEDFPPGLCRSEATWLRGGSRPPGGGTAVIPASRPIKVLLIDSNVYFAKRLSDALKREGFEVTTSTHAGYALTALEYDAPGAILCATNMREMGALEIARIIRADSKNANLPIVALGDGSQRALIEAFQAGCDDYIDRSRQPGGIASHVKQLIVSKMEGFQPAQLLTPSDTSLSGNLTHHDLTGVMQMLGHARQTGALYINAGKMDAVLFYEGGDISHAECGTLFGDEAVIYILKNCVNGNHGIYKFVYGTTSTERTVLRSATDLMLDAMREVDESSRDMADKEAQ